MSDELKGEVKVLEKKAIQILKTRKKVKNLLQGTRGDSFVKLAGKITRIETKLKQKPDAKGNDLRKEKLLGHKKTLASHISCNSCHPHANLNTKSFIRRFLKD